jgi:lysophospholipase L1-like esterase
VREVVRRHNSRGFRSPEIPLEKPPGRVRVLAVGDSMVYGLGVENGEAFPAVLERLDPSLQVVNAGVPAYSGAEELVQLREEIGVLRPDVVVVAYFWNDLFEAYPGRYARFELRDGKLVEIPPDPASPQHPAFASYWKRYAKMMRRYNAITASSYLHRLLSDRLKVLRYQVRDWQAEIAERIRAESHAAAGRESRADEEPAWALSFALLAEMARVAEAHQAKLAILIVPDASQVEADGRLHGAPPYLRDVQQRVGGFARARGIPVIDPLPALRERRQREGRPQYYPTDRHLNALGHAYVAEIALAELRRLGWTPARSG